MQPYRRRLRCFCTLWLIAAVTAEYRPSAAQPPDAKKAFQWVHKRGSSIALVTKDKVVWRFNFGPQQTTPNFFPLAVPGINSIVADRPADHEWHHGLWFSWKFINDVNFWEHVAETKRPEGRTSWNNVQVAARDDGSAKINLDLTYSIADSILLSERRKVAVSATDESGTFTIDWAAEFRAKDKLTLSCLPVPPAQGGVSWGGYGGLSIRFAPDFVQRQATLLQGPVKVGHDGIFRGVSQACDYSGRYGNHAAGIAVFDHPQNPRHPTPWYVIAGEMSFLNASLLFEQPLRLSAGSNLHLKYRIVVHAGSWDARQLKMNYKRFALF